MAPPPFRILLVEDNPHVREMLSYGLERKASQVLVDPGRGVAVDTANDGQQAYHLLCQHPYDLLIVDWYMPVLDGRQLIEKVRADQSALKILVISASSMTANEESIAVGANMFLPKPVRLVDLVEAVRDLLTSA